MTISVVICAYSEERWDDLAAAVASCQGQTLRADEIIVVIDHNDQLRVRAEDEFADVLVISNESARGLSGARNTGVAHSTGDVIAFLDDDAFADPDWLEHLTVPMADTLVAGTGGWIVPHWPGVEPTWYPASFLWVLGCSYDGLPASGARIRNPIGSNMALRRRVMETVGGFTLGIGRIGKVPLGGEETELCIQYATRVPAERFVLSREAVVHHRVPTSRLTWRYFLSRCWAEGLSKAVISRRVGGSTGLAAERAHLVRSVPRDLLASMLVVARDPRAGSKRAAMIVSGAATAIAGLAWGFVFARERQPTSRRRKDGATRPVAGPERFARKEWSPIPIVHVDVDELAEPVAVAAPPGTRLWVEAQQEGQVVAVRDAVVDNDGGLSLVDRQGLLASAREVTSLAVRSLPDELLPRASVVVSTICEEPEQLLDTVLTLLAMDYPEFEVIVVDNRSARFDEPLPEFPTDARLRVVAERRPGVSAGRNRGIEAATGDIVAFTDDDVIVDRNWLRMLGAKFALDGDVEGIGGLVLPQELDTRAQLWFEEFYGGFSQGLHAELMSLRDDVDRGRLFPYAPGRFGAGCNMAFRRSTLRRLGGFDMALGGGTAARGGEDLQVFVSVVLGGGTFAYEPAAMVRHRHRRSEHEFMVQVFDYGIGLTAMFCTLTLRDPSQFSALVRRVPSGLRHLTRSRDERSTSVVPSYPRWALLVQTLGMAYGPLAYARSRLAARRWTRAGVE